MIIYGTKGKLLLKERLFDKCRNCGSSNTIDMYVFQKYGHVFWLPFVPLEKDGLSECTQCKQTFEARQMPEHLMQAFVAEKAKTKTPVWTFGGLAIVLLGIAIFIYTIIQDNKVDAQYILSPMRGDEYEVKTKDGMYTLYGVDHVSGDSVFIRMSLYETDKATALDKIRKKGVEGYMEETIYLPKQVLKQMYDDDQIIEIDR